MRVYEANWFARIVEKETVLKSIAWGYSTGDSIRMTYHYEDDELDASEFDSFSEDESASRMKCG